MIEYVIGVYSGKSISYEAKKLKKFFSWFSKWQVILNEKLHAKYYFDKEYKRQIDDEWAELDAKKREKNYWIFSDKVNVDEYQAYRYSEKANFFGVKL